MSKPKIVIVIGDGTLQRVMTNFEGIDILLLDADAEDEGTELIEGARFWVGILEPDVEGDMVNKYFVQHLQNAREQYDREKES